MDYWAGLAIEKDQVVGQLGSLSDERGKDFDGALHLCPVSEMVVI